MERAHPTNRRGTVVLLTQSFPYRAAMEDSFVEPQLPYLATVFGRIIIVPASCRGTRAILPENVEVWDDLALTLRSKASNDRVGIAGLLSRLTWTDLAARPSLLLSFRGLKRLCATAGRASVMQRWLESRFAQKDIVQTDVVGYSFWCDSGATALSLMKRNSPALTAVARAHGADLYAERHHPPFLPCRQFTFERLDALFTASEDGHRYVTRHFPWFAPRCEVARLGVPEPGFISRRSPRGRLCVVSCSGLVPVKRVDVIAGAIAAAARLRPETEFEWHHFGDGQLRNVIEQQAATSLPANATSTFHGQVEVREILDFYRSHPVDAFVNASESEGGSPVAIMEAASCGIPVVASAVGGNPEIVSGRNGVLTNPRPSAQDLAVALLSLVDDQPTYEARRNGSRLVWETRFQASVNYAAFAIRLRFIADKRSSEPPGGFS